MPNASSTWSRPTKRPFEFRWKHISRLATEPRRCALPPVRGGARARPCGGTGRGDRGHVPTAPGWRTQPRRSAGQGPTHRRIAFVGRDLEWNQLNEAWNTARRGWGTSLVGDRGTGDRKVPSRTGTRPPRSSRGTRGGIGSCVRGCGQTAVGSRRRPAPIGCSPKPHRHARHGLEGRARSSPARTPRRFPASRPSQSGDLAQRHRLFDAVSRAIVVGDRPRLLIIDDLQWCDAETIELIGFVVRSGQTAPVLIVGTVRWEEIPQHHPLVGLVDALGHDQAVTTVPLDRLDEPLRGSLLGYALKTRLIRNWRHDLERDRRQSTLCHRSAPSGSPLMEVRQCSHRRCGRCCALDWAN